MGDVETRVFSKQNTHVYNPQMFLTKGVGFQWIHLRSSVCDVQFKEWSTLVWWYFKTFFFWSVHCLLSLVTVLYRSRCLQSLLGFIEATWQNMHNTKRMGKIIYEIDSLRRFYRSGLSSSCSDHVVCVIHCNC